MRGSPPSRRQLLAAAGVGGLGVAGLTGGPPLVQRVRGSQYSHTDLYAQTVAFTDWDHRVEVSDDEAGRLIPGSRVLDGQPASAGLLAAEDRWLAACAPWVHIADEYSDLLRGALLDVRVLSVGLSAPVAGWSPRWRYVWPRDTTHVALALAAAGHPGAGWDALRFLAGVQREDGWFEARYDPATRRRPDGRERQLDGTGWVLWALAGMYDLDPAGPDAPPAGPAASGAADAELARLARRSVDLILGGLRRGMPPKSPDYWEVGASRVTVGTIAPLLAGLEAAGRLPAAYGRDDRLPGAIDQMRAALERQFGRRGYPRDAVSGPDAATCFLGPPYLLTPARGAEAALTAYEHQARRPAGGLAPGASWRDDGVSWTPMVALTAQVHACAGRTDRAAAALRWLAAHRTEAGSLPEKVLWDGTPAAVAPLAWTASAVIRAVHALRVSR